RALNTGARATLNGERGETAKGHRGDIVARWGGGSAVAVVAVGVPENSLGNLASKRVVLAEPIQEGERSTGLGHATNGGNVLWALQPQAGEWNTVRRPKGDVRPQPRQLQCDSPTPLDGRREDHRWHVEQGQDVLHRRETGDRSLAELLGVTGDG